MDPAFAINIGREALYITMLISGPALLAGLVVGLLIGIFQAVTQIHEMTLTFIPKILAIIGVLFFMMPWIVLKFVGYMVNLYNSIPAIVR